MPSKSRAQHRLMEAVAHSPKFAKKAGIPQSVGKEYAAADQGKSFSKRASGQFGGQRERDGKMNGGGHGTAVHPQTHADFEKL